MIREWFVLQGRLKHDREDPETAELQVGGSWQDQMSLAAWQDPRLRIEALETFRDPALDDPLYPSPYDKWQMVRRTEEVLDE